MGRFHLNVRTLPDGMNYSTVELSQTLVDFPSLMIFKQRIVRNDVQPTLAREVRLEELVGPFQLYDSMN